MTVSAMINRVPILPVITLKKNDASVYTYNPFTSTFDFRLRRAQIKPPYSNVQGSFSLEITSSDGTSSGMNTIISNVDEGNEVTVWVGKSNTTKTKIFCGVIESWNINESNPNFMEVEITGPDFGSDILKNRVVTGQWTQKRDSSNVLDSTDTSTTVRQITTDLLSKIKYYAGADYCATDQGIVYTSSNVQSTIQVPLFNANYEFLDDKLQELDEIAGTTHYVDPDKNFIAYDPVSTTLITQPDVLLVDSNTDSVGLRWTSANVGLISNCKYIRTLENHKRRIFGLGGEQIRIDQSSTTDAGTPTTLETYNYAMRFTPIFQRLSKVSVLISKIGTPTEDFVLEIREDNANTPTGTVIRTVSKPKAFLDGTGTTAVFSPFEINEDLTVGNNYWIVLRKNGSSSSHTFRWHHDNTDHGTPISATSANDVTWSLTGTPNRFYYGFKTYYGTDVFAQLSQNDSITSTDKHLHEDIIKKAELTDQKLMTTLLVQQSINAFKRKEIFSGLVYAPDTILTSGQTVRIRKNASGYTFDSNFVVSDIEYIFEGSDENSTGNFYYTIEAVRYVTIS